jgi:hypothetical protein
MKYIDKDGSEWSIEKGDWVGSFDRENILKTRIKKFSIPLLLIAVLSFILLSWK